MWPPIRVINWILELLQEGSFEFRKKYKIRSLKETNNKPRLALKLQVRELEEINLENGKRTIKETL